VQVTARALNSEAGTLKVAIEVSDSGPGLTPDQQSRLFKPFTQADNTTARRFGGTGLGLALSKRLSEALGGDLTVAEFQPGKGCKFVVTFVALAIERPDSPVKNISSDKTDRPLKDLRILLVDDSPDNLFLVTRILAKNGAVVDVAKNGEEAVEKATQSTHDLVLMDIQMPGMDGYQATRALLAQGYKRPIIALTAHAMMEERAKTRAAGFAAHLTKPLDNQELLQTVIHFAHSS
jgi:CheY-like chemotaxis protein